MSSTSRAPADLKPTYRSLLALHRCTYGVSLPVGQTYKEAKAAKKSIGHPADVIYAILEDHTLKRASKGPVAGASGYYLACPRAYLPDGRRCCASALSPAAARQASAKNRGRSA